MQAVGADHEIGTIRSARPLRSTTTPVARPRVSNSSLGLRNGGGFRAGVGRGVSQHAVQHGASRRVQRVDAELRFDRDGDVLIRITERRGPDRRRVRSDDRRQHAPAMQLQDGAAHQRVRGKRVRAIPAPVDDEHPAAARASSSAVAAPAHRAPTMTTSNSRCRSWTCRDVDVDVHGHAVGEHVEHGRSRERLLHHLAQLLRRRVALDCRS